MTSRGRVSRFVPATPRIAIAALAVFASALLLRLIHLSHIQSAPFVDLLFGDAQAYDDWARQIASGDWIGTGVFYQAPLYPYLLGALYAVAGHDLWLVRIIQAVAGATACTLVALAGQRLFNLRAGLLGGVMLAVYAPAIFFDGIIQKASLDAFLMSLLLYLVVRLIDQPAERASSLGLGIVSGALCLSRENALVLLPVLAWWLWRASRVAARKDRYWPAACFAVGVASLLLPVAVRNLTVSGGFYLTTSQFGSNLFIGNNHDADGTYRALRTGRGTAEFERADATALAERALGRQLTPDDVSAYWTARAVAFVVSEPTTWLRLIARKFLLLINDVEITDTESLQSYAEWSWPLRLLSRVGGFGLLLPLAVIGVWAWRRTLMRAWVIPALVTAYALSVVAFYVMARYRYPLVPVVVLLAAAGVEALPRLARQASRRDQIWLALAVLLVAAVSHWPLLSSDAMQAVGENNIGVALEARGRHDEALGHLRRAIALEKDNPTNYLNVGTVLHSMGRLNEATALFEQALAIQPGLGEAHYFLGKILIEQGRGNDGLAQLQQAAPAMPDSTDVRTALGVALASQGRFDAAVQTFRQVVVMSPESGLAHWNLGSALAAMGSFDEAVTELQESVRLDPTNARAAEDLVAAQQLRGDSHRSR